MSIFDPGRGARYGSEPDSGIGRFDNPVAAGLRFFMELMAVIGTGVIIGATINPILGIAAGLALQAVISIFSTRAINTASSSRCPDRSGSSSSWRLRHWPSGPAGT